MTSNQIVELERLINVVASAPGIDGERLPILTQLRDMQRMLSAGEERDDAELRKYIHEQLGFLEDGDANKPAESLLHVAAARLKHHDLKE